MDAVWYKDWKFWLLFAVINMSGNLGFGILFPDKLFIIVFFLFTLATIIYNRLYSNKVLFFVLSLFIITFLPGLYESSTFSYSSAFHILMKAFIGIATVVILREYFVNYYIKIILFFCVVSLIGFFLNSIGMILPYISIESTKLDGGNIYRVSSVIYTQLYNLNAGGITLRNCGPFWEPGAYQGFLNLAIALLILSTGHRDRRFYILFAIFSVAVITTFSTGGYVVLSCNILYLILTEMNIRRENKVLIVTGLLLIFLLAFLSIDFLYDKISKDDGRLGVSLDDLGDTIHLLFGYGYSADTISQSGLKTASGLLGLLKYSGVFGFALYLFTLLGTRYTMGRICWVLIVCLILMNEPFLTAGPFWWGVPFIMDYMPEPSSTTDLKSNGYVAQT